jgi:hypothetical protein
MIHGDFLKLHTKDWRDADIVFANSTCYDETIMQKMAKIACESLCVLCCPRLIASISSGGMKKGSFVITLTKRLPSTDFAVIESDMHKMSWGEATIFVLQKVTEPYTDNHGDSDDE